MSVHGCQVKSTHVNLTFTWLVSESVRTRVRMLCYKTTDVALAPGCVSGDGSARVMFKVSQSDVDDLISANLN